MCALRWYIKSLYRHLFLIDISKHTRVTHFLICGKDNWKAPWATRPQIGLRVAKARSCDTWQVQKKLRWTPPSYSVDKRRDHRNCVGGCQISVIPPLLSTITKGRCTGIFFRLVSITVTCFSNPHTNLGGHLSRRLELSLPQIRKCHFFSDPCVFGYIY